MHITWDLRYISLLYTQEMFMMKKFNWSDANLNLETNTSLLNLNFFFSFLSEVTQEEEDDVDDDKKSVSV